MALFIESGTLTLSGTDTGTITFSRSYSTIPKVVAIATGDVNVYIESVTSSGAIVKTSAIFSGDIYYQAMTNE